MSNYINRISGRVLKIVATIAVIVSITIVYKEDTYAASFGHVHTDECYQTVTGVCSDHHIGCDGWVRTFHCDTCGGMRSFSELDYYDVCERGLKPNEHRAYVQTCMSCGSPRDVQSPGNPGSHSYTARELACGKNESTPIANIGLSAVSSAPTNGSVKLVIGVSDAASEFSLAAAPYNFGAGNTSDPSFEVTENGTYNATVTDSYGRTVTVSFTVDSIDRANPVIDGISKNTEDWSESGVTITVSAHDEGLGLAGDAYSFNGGAFGEANTYHVTLNGNVSVRVKDAAGNITESSISIANCGRDPKVVEAERREAERIAAEKVAAEKAEADKIAAEKEAAEKAAKEKAAKEKAAKDKADKSKSSGTTSQKNVKTSDTESVLGKTTKETDKTDVSGNSIFDYFKNAAASGSAISNGAVLSSKGGKLITVRDLTKTETDMVADTNEEEVIESLYDLYEEVNGSDEEVADSSEVAKEQSVSILKASVGDYTVMAGILLLLAGTLIISQFSYVYVMQGGKKRLICRCRVVKSQDGLLAVVPGKKLTSHGKYLLYISPWKKGFKKKVPVSVMLEGEDGRIPTDEGVAFKY